MIVYTCVLLAHVSLVALLFLPSLLVRCHSICHFVSLTPSIALLFFFNLPKCCHSLLTKLFGFCLPCQSKVLFTLPKQGKFVYLFTLPKQGKQLVTTTCCNMVTSCKTLFICSCLRHLHLGPTPEIPGISCCYTCLMSTSRLIQRCSNI